MGSGPERQEFFTGKADLPDGFWACASALLMTDDGWFAAGSVRTDRGLGYSIPIAQSERVVH